MWLFGVKVEKVLVTHFFHIQFFATPWTTAHQASLALEFSRQELGWVAIPFSRGSSQPRNQAQVSCIADRFIDIWATREAGDLRWAEHSSSSDTMSDYQLISVFFFFFCLSPYTFNYFTFQFTSESLQCCPLLSPFTELIIEKRESSRKTSISALLTMPKHLIVWITINCGKFWKRWEYQTTWPTSWETCILRNLPLEKQVRKQQLELDMEQQTGSK